VQRKNLNHGLYWIKLIVELQSGFFLLSIITVMCAVHYASNS